MNPTDNYHWVYKKYFEKNENPKIKYEILKFVNSKIDKQLLA
jgi:hypothetical protein